MDTLNELRKQIDTIDDQLMLLLEQRFNIAKQVGLLKQVTKQSLEDKNRENSILMKSAEMTHRSAIESVYQSIFSQSKLLQRKL